jgi:hypothetical protein
MKDRYLKYFEERIDYAYQKKCEMKQEGRHYASYEWGAAADALEDARKEFLRVFSQMTRD